MRRLAIPLLTAAVALSCGSANPNKDSGAYCMELATRFCDQQISCNLVASSHRKDCVEALRINVCGVRANEAQRGLFKMNEKLTTQCLKDLKSTGCTREGSALGSACFSAIEPAVESGGKCETDSHCRDINQRCIGAGCERTCQTAGGNGEPCRPSGTAGVGTCNTGLTCDASGKCSRGGATGAECSTTLLCDPDNFCDNATDKCVALPTAGQNCRAGFPQCAEASFCNLLMCTARLGVGGACLSSAQCVVGTVCKGGTCQALVAEGGGCMQSSDCASGLSCDNVALTCQKAKRVFFEESCSSTNICSSGLTCRNVKPAVNGAAGTAGTCGLAAVGDNCFATTSCPPYSFCQPAAVVTDPGTCTATASGKDMCTSDRECVEGESCHAQDRKCVSRAGVGGNCQFVSCVANATCVRRGAAQVCVEPADLQKTCSNDMVEATPCRSPLICARTTCISAGRKGEACIGGAMGSCFQGACLDGVCVDPRPDGATCRQDTDCQSIACERGICVQACK